MFAFSPIQALNLIDDLLNSREVDMVDIAYDEVTPKHYKAEEDLKQWRSEKTGRGPLGPDWRNSSLKPMMCSYKLVSVSFEVWGLQTRVEDYVQRAIREVLLVGHRQAVAWLDQWFEMTEEDVRKYEERMHTATNEKVLIKQCSVEGSSSSTSPPASPSSSPKELQSPLKRGWFNWS